MKGLVLVDTLVEFWRWWVFLARLCGGLFEAEGGLGGGFLFLPTVVIFIYLGMYTHWMVSG